MKHTTRPAIFKWRQTAPELILCAVRWYLRYSLSLRYVEELLAHARGAADHFLDAYYHAGNFTHNPFKLAEKQTTAVQVDSILKASPHGYQVRWTETQRDLNGVVIGGPTHWEALLQAQIVPPNTEEAIVSNPLGFYVTQLSWTEQRD